MEEKAKKPVLYHNGIQYDSIDELAFLHWAFELKENGFIKSIARADTYVLSRPFLRDYNFEMKTKVKTKTQKVLNQHVYTPEFLINWDDSAKDLFFEDIDSQKRIISPTIAQFDEQSGNYQGLIEVKPSFDQNNMERLFIINQKWMWSTHKRFVNLIKVKELFPETFTPNKYLLTKTGKDKKINWLVKDLKQFIKESNGI